MSDEIVDDLSNLTVNAIVDRDDAQRALDAAIARAKAAETELPRLRARLEEYDAEWRPHPDATAGEEGEA